jgi:hypothetical protein
VLLIVLLALRWLTPETRPLMADTQRVAVRQFDAIAHGAAMAAITVYRAQRIARPRLPLCVSAILIVEAWEDALKLVVSRHLATILMLNVSSRGLVLMLPAAVQVQRTPSGFAAAAQRSPRNPMACTSCI